MILIGQNQELKDLGFKMCFPVHDEIIAECPFENRKRCGELLSSLMIQAGAEKINIPMKCDTARVLLLVWTGSINGQRRNYTKTIQRFYYDRNV